MRNSGISETQLMGKAAELVRSMMPQGWSIDTEVAGRKPASRSTPDFVLCLRSNKGVEGRLEVEVKRNLTSREIVLIRERAQKSAITVVARFLSPRARELLSAAGINFIDTTGNMRVVMNRPLIVLSRNGLDRDPEPERRDVKSIKGPAAARLVRALCDRDIAFPAGVRELAAIAGTSAPTVARALALLDEEAIVTRGEGGAVLSVDRVALIRRWVQDYSVFRNNRYGRFLEPRGLPALADKLRSSPKLEYCLTGSMAGAILAPEAPARLGLVYVRDVPDAAEALSLTPAEGAANVILLEPFDDVVFESTKTVDGLKLAAPSQVAADLFGTGGRGPAEAEAILRTCFGATASDELMNEAVTMK